MGKKETNTAVVQASVAETVERLQRKANTDIRALTDFTIRTRDQYDEAAKRVSRLKVLRKEADAQEKSITDPANLIVKNAKAIFKPFKDRVDLIETTIKEQMVIFLESREKKADALIESSKGVSRKAISKIAELQDTKSEHASARKIATVHIDDVSIIPREYLMPDEAKIKAALMSGKRVKGCSLVNKTSIAI